MTTNRTWQKFEICVKFGCGKRIDGKGAAAQRLSLSKASSKDEVFDIMEEKGGAVMDEWKKDVRRDVVFVDIDTLVPQDHLLRKIEKVMDP